MLAIWREFLRIYFMHTPELVEVEASKAAWLCVVLCLGLEEAADIQAVPCPC